MSDAIAGLLVCLRENAWMARQVDLQELRAGMMHACTQIFVRASMGNGNCVL